MATYKHSSGKRFFLIHIPRTAGRFLHYNMVDNEFYVEQKDRFLTKNPVTGEIQTNPLTPWTAIENAEIAHFHRYLYEKYLDVEGIPHIAVIRNPINRFIACSMFLKKMYGDDVQERLEDPEMFFKLVGPSQLRYLPLPYAESWFRPQVDFITHKTHIWKFESGFGKEFEKWISKILDVKFKLREYKIKNLENMDETNKVEKTDKLVKNIKKLYNSDIETFYKELR
mgnify:CR=1 FL=1|tara:strand:+ start:117 stop:794 length:678 start_codon:yes stop_codon:yes gene_type:complete